VRRRVGEREGEAVSSIQAMTTSRCRPKT
jgi:hypothetical protein